MNFHVKLTRGLAWWLGLLAVAASPASAADSNTAREYREAVAAHEKALAAATAPENKRYSALLDTLLRHAEMEGDLETKARVAEAIKTLADQAKSAAASNPFREQCLGAWQITYDDSASLFHIEIVSDGTVNKDGRPAGVWEIKNNRLQIVYDGKYTDAFDLPVRDGQLHGRNGFKVGLTLTREGKIAPLGPINGNGPGKATPGYFGNKK